MNELGALVVVVVVVVLDGSFFCSMQRCGEEGFPLLLGASRVSGRCHMPCRDNRLTQYT